jgi:PAS domain S-box-containing protein
VTLNDEEDELLRSVALQNAASIFIARQRAAQRSEFYLAEGQRLAQIGSWAITPSGFFDYWSPELFRIFGFDPSNGAPALDEFLASVHPQDREKMAGTMQRMLRESAGCDVKHRILRPNGELRYLRTVGVPVFDDGALKGFVGTTMDVTEQENLTRELQRREMYLAEAQRLSRTGSFSWKASTREMLWSEEHFRIFQYDPAEKPTVDHILRRVHPEDAALVKEKVARAAREKKDYEFQHRLLMPDGSVKHVHVLGRALRDDSGGVEFVGAVMDVTERKQAEMLLSGEKRLLEMIARGASLLHILDALCRLVEELANGSLCSILLLDSNNRLRHGAAPSLPAKYNEAIDGLAIGPSRGSCGTAAYRAQTVIVSDIAADPLWAEFRDLASRYGLRACWSRPILSSDKKVLGTFATYYREPRSPTPREYGALEQIANLASIAIEREQAQEMQKRAEEGLRQTQADLAHVTRVTTMGELTASLAHEVNQPITAAVTNANACLRWLAGDAPNLGEARAAATRIVRDGTRAAEIISRIRLLFKKGAPQSEAVDVNEVIREMIVLLHSEATRYSISVRAELSAHLPRVPGDRVHLQQVMMNLIMNSIEAMKDVEGRRELAIHSQRAEGEQLLVSVSDTGVGLPQQHGDQIFNAFFTTKPDGTGMGLSISRSILESHGGRLWAAENPPRGASFYFTLPTSH